MKYRVVDLLCSVPDRSRLRLAKVSNATQKGSIAQINRVQCSQFCAFKNCPARDGRVKPSDCTECYTHEVIEGELCSESGKTFAIHQGLPRVISEHTAEFIGRNQASFSLEWKYFRFGERNWGQSIDERKQRFLQALGQEAAQLENKTIFDAGCGSGLLSIEMARSFGMEVVAMDISSGIEQAYHHNTNPHVHFIQGSVMEPPLKDDAADFVYCAGVLVALPDTHAGFKCLCPCVKPNGRFFIWLYHPFEYHRATGDYNRVVRRNWIRQRITSHLPIRLQEWVYLSLIPLYFGKRLLLNPFRSVKVDLTYREKMQNLIDALSPIYMNRHEPDEAAAWFREAGFSNVQVSYREQYGFGIRGDKSPAREQ